MKAADPERGQATDAGSAAAADPTHGQQLLAQVCTPAELEMDAEGALEAYAEQASGIISKYLTFIVEPGSATQLADLLRGTQVVKMQQKQPADTVGCVYMVQHAGESDHMPHVRPPRFRAENVKMVAYAMAMAASQDGASQDAMPPACRFLLADASPRGGNYQAMSKCFLQQDGKMMPKHANAVYLMFDETSLTERKARVQGRIDLMQQLYVFSPLGLNLSEQRTID